MGLLRESWHQIYKTFSYAFDDHPLGKKDDRPFLSAGVGQPDAIPDIRAGGGGGGGSVRLRDSNDFVDLSTVTNRLHRYKEYERLRNMAEIESAMTVFADETCVSGDTLVATPAHGYRTIKWLAENMKERFLVYCWDFNKNDFTLGWAFDPRKTKTAPTVQILFSNGLKLVCTHDHRIMMEGTKWLEAGKIRMGDFVHAFHRIDAKQSLTKQKMNQFPRIYSHRKGWIHERQFTDEWRLDKDLEQYDRINTYCRWIVGGMTHQQIQENFSVDHHTLNNQLRKGGFSNTELKWLAKKEQKLRVIGVYQGPEVDVYDLSVEGHENFCTDWGVVHNCQRDENGRAFQIVCKNEEVRKELEDLAFNRRRLHLSQTRMWNLAKNLYISGDYFWEVCIDIDNPKLGVRNLEYRPPDSMYRIETTKGRLVEFQQSKEGPDYNSLARIEITKATDADLAQATAIRFTPEQIIHFKIGDERQMFYPYGISLIEPARGPAHQLRLMEDSMVVYRLSRAPERRIFYIDTKQMSPARQEALIERMKSQFKKKKIPKSGSGATGVEERWHAPAVDEDYWVPLGQNSQTRIETLPGAQNLGEVDDTVYFRNKLYVALNFPRNYLTNEDPQTSKLALSQVDYKFSRLIERLQSHIEIGLIDLFDRHLKLLGWPEEEYEDLEVKMTPPSDSRELARQEVIASRIQNAGSLKTSQLMSDYDCLTLWMKYPEDEVKKMLARNKIQKLEELKLQIIGQNPALLGVGVPGDEEEQISTEPSEENPMPGGMEPPPEMGGEGEGEEGMEGGEGMEPMPAGNKGSSPVNIPKPSEEDIKKYDLDIKDYSQEMDKEEIDRSEF